MENIFSNARSPRDDWMMPTTPTAAPTRLIMAMSTNKRALIVSLFSILFSPVDDWRRCPRTVQFFQHLWANQSPANQAWKRPDYGALL